MEHIEEVWPSGPHNHNNVLRRQRKKIFFIQEDFVKRFNKSDWSVNTTNEL